MIIVGTDMEIPDSLIAEGDLDLCGTNVTSLPAGLSVCGRLYVDAGQLFASEEVQLEWIGKGADMLQVFKAPTEKAQRLHEMMWDL